MTDRHLCPVCCNAHSLPFCEDSCPVAEEPLQTNRCPEPDAYGMCVCCGHRYKVSCTCGTTFAERARKVNIDTETLRKFHGN